MRINVVFHYVRVCRGDDHLPFLQSGPGIPDHHLCVKRFQNIPVRRFRHGNNRRVIFIHVRLRDIIGRDQTLQMILLIRNSESKHIVCLHEFPGVFHRDLSIDAGRPADLHIFHAGSYILQISRLTEPKPFQHILRFRRNSACSAGHVFLRAILSLQLVLQIRIGDRGADGICIRILVSDNAHGSFICHVDPSPGFYSHSIAGLRRKVVGISLPHVI